VKTVLLRLEGPFQAWSSQGRFGIRDTEREPTKSGVLGLVGAALGMPREDEDTLAELGALKMAVRIDRAGALLHDYHTAGGGRFRGEQYTVYGSSDCVPSHRYYLTDASFVVGLEGEDTLIDRIGAALLAPHWPLFLGRRSCVPTSRVWLGVSETNAATAVREAADPEPRDGAIAVDEGARRMVIETPKVAGAEIRYDVPRSFAPGSRLYGQRYVQTKWTEQRVEATP